MAEPSVPARGGLALVLAATGLLLPGPGLSRQTPAPAPAPPRVAVPEAPTPEALAAAQRGALLFDQRQYAAALVELEKALAGGVRDGRTLYRAAESQRWTGKARADVLRTLSEALTTLNRVLHAGGKMELADHAFLAFGYADIGNAAAAGKTARAALDAYRRGELGVVTEMPVTDLLRLGRLASLAGDVQLRKAFFSRAVDRLEDADEPDQVDLALALTGLGTALVEAGDTQAAVASLSRVMAMETPPPAARPAFARALFRSGDYAAAAKQWSALRVEQPVLASEAIYAMMIMRTLAQEEFLRTPDRPLEDVKGLSQAELEQRMLEIGGEMAAVTAELPPELVQRGRVRKDSDAATREKMLGLRDLKLRLAWTAAEYIDRGHPIREFAFANGIQASLRNWNLPETRRRATGPPPPLPPGMFTPQQRAEYEAALEAHKLKRKQRQEEAANDDPEQPPEPPEEEND